MNNAINFKPGDIILRGDVTCMVIKNYGSSGLVKDSNNVWINNFVWDTNTNKSILIKPSNLDNNSFEHVMTEFDKIFK